MNDYTRTTASALKVGDRVLSFDDRTGDNLGFATVTKITELGPTRKDADGNVTQIRTDFYEVEMRSQAPEKERETWTPDVELMVCR